MTIKLVVFDFDGTLADTKKLIFAITKNEFKKGGCKLPKHYWKIMGSNQLKTDIALCYTEENVHTVTDRINAEILKNINKITPAKNIFKIKEIPEDKVILTNNIDEIVKAFLEYNKLSFFSDVYGASRIHDKIDGFKKIMNKRKLNPKEIVYVGDIALGVLICKKIGAHCVSISNGISWDTRQNILKARPEFIIEDLQDIKGIISKLNGS